MHILSLFFIIIIDLNNGCINSLASASTIVSKLLILYANSVPHWRRERPASASLVLSLSMKPMKRLFIMFMATLTLPITHSLILTTSPKLMMNLK